MSAKAYHIAEDLAPKEKEPANGVAELTVASEGDDADVEIVVDLITRVFFDLRNDLVRIWDLEVLNEGALVRDEFVMVRKDVIDTGSVET